MSTNSTRSCNRISSSSSCILFVGLLLCSCSASQQQHGLFVTSADGHWDGARSHALQYEMLGPVIENAARSSSRQLQQAGPDAICEQYNNRSDAMVFCSCSQEQANVLVDCKFLNPFCSTDMSSCIESNYVQVLDASSNSIQVTTTSFDSIAIDPIVTSIRTLPTAPNNFNPIASCSVRVQLSRNLPAITCNSCSTCGFDAATNATSLVINCCNVQDGLQQSCYASGGAGTAFPAFDEVIAGQCSGSTIDTSNTVLYAVFSSVLSALVAFLY